MSARYLGYKIPTQAEWSDLKKYGIKHIIFTRLPEHLAAQPTDMLFDCLHHLISREDNQVIFGPEVSFWDVWGWLIDARPAEGTNIPIVVYGWHTEQVDGVKTVFLRKELTWRS